ncbi:MAG: TraB/GumN family protein [Oceanospirillaceae bacterium]|nr:TraB/GumN family protein [Oceanospirillaceae bacterium]
MKAGSLSKVLALIALLMAPVLTLAEGTVWRVTGSGGNALFLAGTVHLLRPQDLPLPAVYDRAYEQADELVFETDLAELMNPATQLLLAKYLQAPQGGRLSGRVSADTWRLLSDFARSRGLAPEMLDVLRPGGVMLTLLGVEMARLGATEEGVDLRLYRRAAVDGKPSSGLEPLEQHLGYLIGMGEEDTDLFVRQMVEEFEASEQVLAPLIAAWQSGSEKALEQLLLDEMRGYPSLYERLLVQRNELWRPVLEAMLASPQTELVLVGAAHLVGPDGLLEMLRAQQGISVVPVD